MQGIIHDYIDSGQPWPAPTRDIARWATDNGHWEPQRSAVVGQCAEHLARAMREEYITDAQGRRLRAKHAATITRDDGQLTLWDDIRTASRKHMEVAFQQRRHQILADCKQLRTDVDSYNENANPGEPIQMIFDFTYDLAEIAALANAS